MTAGRCAAHGVVDTDLTRGIDVPKSTPQSIVRHALDAPEAGAEEILADAATRQVRQSLSLPVAAYLAVMLNQPG